MRKGREREREREREVRGEVEDERGSISNGKDEEREV